MALVVLSGCATDGEEVLKPAQLEKFTPTVAVDVVWQAKYALKSPQQDLRLVPSLTADRLVVVEPAGRLVALDWRSGARVWATDLGMPLSAGVGSGGGLLVAGTLNGDVFAVNEDGQLRWHSVLSSSILSAPVVAQNSVVVRTADGGIHALDAVSGRQLWQEEGNEPALTLYSEGRPLVSGEQLLVGTSSGRMVALSLGDGRQQWETVVAAPQGRSELERVVDVDADPLLFDGMLYASAFQGRTVAISPVSGRLVWTSDVATHVGMAADDKTLYLGSNNDTLWALERSTGSVMWKQEDLLHRQLSPPLVAHDLLVVGDGEGYLHVLSAVDGHMVGRYRLGRRPITARPLLADDRIYVMDQAGHVAALRLTRH